MVNEFHCGVCECEENNNVSTYDLIFKLRWKAGESLRFHKNI